MRRPFDISLDQSSGVPVYRQLIDRILMAIALGVLKPGDQLPTVRQMAVNLAINPNTVVRAYRELEIRRVLTTQQGVGTYVTREAPDVETDVRDRRLTQIALEFLAKGAAEGYKPAELLERARLISTEKAPK
ncbi:MAG TPA: GntR family transcriptional regulator [Bryobacteraceae bacterium]|nr:GntR family transcriptional regulator [Bryobacteraceae bacterium]